MRTKTYTSAIVLGIAGASFSQFVPGRLALVGPSSTTNSNAYAIIFRQLLPCLVSQSFLDSYTDANQLPNTISMSGGSPLEGKISRSSLGRFLYFPAYNAANGTTSLSGTSAVASGGVQRVIGRLDFSANLNASNTSHVATQVSAFTGVNIRSATMSENQSTPGAWAVGSNTGLVYSAFGVGYTPGTNSNSTIVSNANTNNRQVIVFRNCLFVAASTTNPGVHRVVSLATGTATMSRFLNTTSSSIPMSAPSSIFITSDADATATTGRVYLYVADDGTGSPNSPGIVKYTSSNGWEGTFQSGTSPSATAPYRLSSTATTSLCVEGNVVYAVNGSANIFSIWDGGSAASSFTVATNLQGGTTTRGVAMAPTPLVADSNYSSGGAVAGNIMTLRSGNESQRTYRVGLVPDSGTRSWTSFNAENHTGTVIKSAVDSAGNTYVLLQSTASGGNSTIVPTITLEKIPYGGGSKVASTTINLPTDYEPFGIFVDDTNRPVVACRGGTGLRTVRIARWAADLTGGSLNATTFTSGTNFPVDISAEPGGYAILGFGSAGTFGWNSIAVDLTSSANGTATISNDGTTALTPISAKFGATDGFLRVMSAGTGADRALFRVDSLDAAKTSATASTRSYRRDGTAPGTSYTGNTATAPAYMLPWTMSMSSSGAKVLMLHTSEPNSGPGGPGAGAANRNDVYVGAGRIWNFDSTNQLTATGIASTYRFAPGIAPVN